MVRPVVASFPLFSSSLAVFFSFFSFFFFFICWLEFRNEISLKPRSALCRVGCAEVLDQWNQSDELQSAWEAAEEDLDSRVPPPSSSPTLVLSRPRILSACDLDDIHRYHTQHCAWALHTKYLCPHAPVFAHQPGLRTFSLSRRPARIYYRIKLLPERHFVLKGRWIEFEKHFFSKIKKPAFPLSQLPST